MKKFTIDEILVMDKDEFTRRWNDNSIQASCLVEFGRNHAGEFDENDLPTPGATFTI